MNGLTRALVTLLTIAAAPHLLSAQWLEQRTPTYTILYQASYEKDAAFTRLWMDRTEALMKSKYGVTAEQYRISFYLHPAPNDVAGVNQAKNTCCTTVGGLITGKIDYLSPSAPAWTPNTSLSSLGQPKNDSSYHAKVIVSEYIPIGHYAAQAARPGGGWGYYDAPDWVSQGLQEYDAIFHTTEANRTITAASLRAWAKRNEAVFSCCTAGLVIGDKYNGGAAFFAFLAERFGEDVHARLLRSGAKTFDEALAEVTKPYALPALFDQFRAWLRAP